MRQTKPTIAILMGGPSAERAVSLMTGRKIAQSLNREKFNLVLIEISKKGDWLLKEGERSERKRVALSRTQSTSQGVTLYKDFNLRLSKSRSPKIDLVFIALHGPYGEDGTVQGVLELAGIPYTGSGVLASALGMNKVKSRELFQYYGLKVPRYKLVETHKIEIHKFPVVVKPNSLGSSVGVSLVKKQRELKGALKEAFQYDREVLVEEYLEGREVSCGVLENFKGKRLFALPPIEIMPQKDFSFFDYEAKYTKGATEEICPAPLSSTLTKKVQRAALLAHQALGCRHYSRTDMIIKQGRVYVLEINTLPGMTATSLFPQEAQAVGLAFPQLLEHIIELARVK